MGNNGLRKDGDKAMQLYKLTDDSGRTYNNTQWSEGSTHTASGDGDMCRQGWIHAYTHPLLAVLLNPIQLNGESNHLKRLKLTII